MGKLFFQSVEPFGSYLRKKINNDAIADKYVFQELYDSTLTVARQIAEKNKFKLEGEYKACFGCRDTVGSFQRSARFSESNGWRSDINRECRLYC